MPPTTFSVSAGRDYLTSPSSIQWSMTMVSIYQVSTNHHPSYFLSSSFALEQYYAYVLLQGYIISLRNSFMSLLILVYILTLDTINIF